MGVVGSFWPLNEMNEPTFTPPFSLLDPFPFSWLPCTALHGLSKQNNQFLWRRLLSSRLVKSDWASSPPLKYPSSIFIWRRGSSRKIPLFINYSAKYLCRFFHRFEENWHGQIRNGQGNCIFTNDIWQKLATGWEPNHKTEDRPQTRFCNVRRTPNRNEEKWTLPLFENLEIKSSPKRMSPKNTEKSGHFYFYLGDLVRVKNFC